MCAQKPYLADLRDTVPENKYSFEILLDYVDGGYDTRAYQHAYWVYGESEELFIFMHDSVEIKSKDWYDAYTGKLEEGDVCAWVTFTDWYDNQEQVDFVQSNFGEYAYERGVFAPMFCIKSENLRKVFERTGIGNVMVYNKWTQQAMERGWAIAFRQAGLKLTWLDTLDWNRMHNNGYEHFKKSFPTRQ